MRKHFLLLMLMSLLSVASWANPAALNGVNVNIVLSNQLVDDVYQLEYVGVPTAPGLNTLTVGEDSYSATEAWYNLYEFEYFDAADAVTALDEMKNAGDYWVGIKAKAYNENYTGSCRAEDRVHVKVNKGTLHITLQDATKAYGDADPDALQVIPGTGLKGNDTENNIGLAFVGALPREADETIGEKQFGFTLNAVSEEITALNYDIILDAQPKLTITRAPLKVYYDPVEEAGAIVGSADIFAKYRANNLTLVANAENLAFVGLVNGDVIGTENGQLNPGTLTLTPSAKTANVTYNTTADNFATEGYGLLPEKEAHAAIIGLSNVSKDGDDYILGNYNVTFVNPNLYIQQVEIKAAPEAGDDVKFSFTQDDSEFEFNGTKQVPSNIVIKYQTNNPEAPAESADIEQLAVTTDYTISYKRGGVADAENKNAGNYVAYVKATANGNYYTADEGIAVAVLNYGIAQKPITVYIADGSKTYNGEAASTEDMTIGWSGLIAADAAANQAKTYFEAEFVNATDVAIAAPVNASATAYKVKAKAKEAWTGSILANNYNPSYSKANFFINPKAASITAEGQEITFGEVAAIVTTAYDEASVDEPVHIKTVTLADFINADKDNILAAYELKLKAGEYNAARPYANAIEVKKKDNLTDAINTTVGNYTIALNPATFTVNSTTFTVFAKENTKVYGTEFTLDAAGGFEYGTINFNGTWPQAATVSYTLQNENEENITLADAKNVGTYYIVPTVNNWPTNSDYAAPAVQKGIFKITPKAITITPKAQAVAEGSTAAALALYNENDRKIADWGGKLEGDVIAYSLVFNQKGENCVTVNDGGALTSGVGTYANGITGVEINEANWGENTYANKNYTITFAKAALTILGANTLYLAKDDDDLAGKITAAAEACVTEPEADPAAIYTVKFGEIKMNAQEWYAMVLPFEVDPLKMVKAFGRYVIFNRLNIAQTDDQNFKFTLTMNPIPAGTPFLIKFAGEEGIDWSDFNDYGQVAIVAGISDEKKEGIISFTGTYEKKVLQGLKDDNGGDKVWWLCDKTYQEGAKGNNWLKPKNHAHTALPMEAYLKAADGWNANYAPRITVEDFDGSVTSIKSISVDEIHGMTAKGMYNLNGMKMNSVPTQKGVYIVNGKKVVIK